MSVISASQQVEIEQLLLKYKELLTLNAGLALSSDHFVMDSAEVAHDVLKLELAAQLLAYVGYSQ